MENTAIAVCAPILRSHGPAPPPLSKKLGTLALKLYQIEPRPLQGASQPPCRIV